MANLTGGISAPHSDTSVVDASQQVATGTRARDTAGNEYIYLKGVGSTGAGSWVTYNITAGTTALLTANAVGAVAIAMAAVDATTKFGWYQIFGTNTVAKTDTVAANTPLYIDGTDGRADDAVVAGDLIVGAFARSADSSNVATVDISYPVVTDKLG